MSAEKGNGVTMPVDFDRLEAETFSPLGDHPAVFVELDEPLAAGRAAALAGRSHAIVVGLDRTGALPTIDPHAFDLLLSTASAAPTPWVSVPVDRFDARVAAIRDTIARAPVAASLFTRVLRIGEQLPFSAAIALESVAYSTLLGGGEFSRWLSARPASDPSTIADDVAFVTVTREADLVTITLDQPTARNAICARMRDALWAALAAVLDDPTRPRVRLAGAGACFSTGGSLAEFGSARDLAQAHVIRTMRSCAELLRLLGERAEVVLHGACIGSGIEIPAAAARRTARPGAYFQLPEIRMGLMPGAGGTVTIGSAIGRHRTAYLGLSARRIDLATALDWGLVQDMVAT